MLWEETPRVHANVYVPMYVCTYVCTHTQSTLEQRRLELHGTTYSWLFFNTVKRCKYIFLMFSQYQFLFSSLLRCKNTVCNTHTLQIRDN